MIKNIFKFHLIHRFTDVSLVSNLYWPREGFKKTIFFKIALLPLSIVKLKTSCQM